jgi:hypothetical protein
MTGRIGFHHLQIHAGFLERFDRMAPHARSATRSWIHNQKNFLKSHNNKIEIPPLPRAVADCGFRISDLRELRVADFAASGLTAIDNR